MNGKILNLSEVGSTNTFGREHFDEYPDGTLIVAETQTAGRGRLGREWVSPKGNVYASYLVKRPFGEGGFHATMVSSLAVLAAVREILPECGAYVKWPNDVFVGEKKLAGILCEGILREGALKGIVCGIGVNVNLPEKILERIGQPAVSLCVIAGKNILLKKFIKRLAFFLERYYITGISSCPAIYAEWKSENRILGRDILLKSSSGMEFRAKALDIAPDGTLLIRRTDGTEEHFSCGDVKVVPGTEI